LVCKIRAALPSQQRGRAAPAHRSAGQIGGGGVGIYRRQPPASLFPAPLRLLTAGLPQDAPGCLRAILMSESPILKPAHRDLEYVSGGGERNTLDLYLPASASKPLPLLIWIHGGGWAFGLKEVCPAAAFTERGYAVASINYRLSGQAIF